MTKTCAETEMNHDDFFEFVYAAAQNGNAVAQRRLGLLYDGGKGVTQDEKKAFKWKLTAAENGDGSAQLSIASQYMNGWNVGKNPSEAKRWWTVAANDGHMHAQFMLASHYIGPDFGSEDFDAAIFWLRKAAHQNIPHLQYSLGEFEGCSLGGELNYEQSYYWLEIAQLNGYQISDGWIDGVLNELRPVQIAEIKQKALAFVDGCRKFQRLLSQFDLEFSNTDGKGPTSTGYAILFYKYEWKDQIEPSTAETHYKLGSLCYLYEGNRNLKRTESFLRKAKEAGHLKAQKALAELKNSRMQF